MQTRTVLARTTLALVLCSLAAPVVAQDMAMPEPSPKLKVFAPLVGTWTGAGNAFAEAGAPGEPWTATVEMKPILGGFFFQDDTRVDIPGVSTPLQLRTIYGWDAENSRYVGYGLGNSGEAHLVTAHSPKPGTVVMCFAGEHNGQAVSGRSIWRADGDKMSYSSERAIGDGEWFTEVEGQFERSDAAPKAAAVDASFMDMPVSTEMTRVIDAMCGTYDVEGTMTMMPGTPEVSIHGVETMRTLYGGHAVFSRVEGHSDGSDSVYVGQNYMTWNQVDGCYDVVMLDNMGAVMKSQARFVDDGTLVTVMSGPMMGAMTAQRSVIKIDEYGVTEASSYSLTGAHEPMLSFHAKYTRRAH